MTTWLDELEPVAPTGTPDEQPTVQWIQQRLEDRGFPVGPVDGQVGDRTRGAIQAFAEGRSLEGEPGIQELQRELLDATLSPTVAQAGAWAWPVPGVVAVSSPFCNRSGRHHQGIDIPARRGRDIGAARAGKVLHAGWNDGGFGFLVILGHDQIPGYGVVHSYYAHMREQPAVSVGQYVPQLKRLGAVDNTGSSEGDHLHFEIHVNCAAGTLFSGTPANPCTFLAEC